MIAYFHPDYPDREFYTIVALFLRLGYFATRDPEAPFDFAVSWKDATWLDEDPLLTGIARRTPVVNLACRDISKLRVEKVFCEVFGRQTLLDPREHSGRLVEKHNENALGGRVVTGPIAAPDSRFVYQRLIETGREDRMVEYRLPVVFDRLPLVYEQEKALPNETIKTEKFRLSLAEVDAVFSSAEQAGIRAFCCGMGLDFGELDILRDKADGEIYILDANKTPGGFGMLNRMHWQAAQRQTAIGKLAAAFETGIEERLKGFGR